MHHYPMSDGDTCPRGPPVPDGSRMSGVIPGSWILDWNPSLLGPLQTICFLIYLSGQQPESYKSNS